MVPGFNNWKNDIYMSLGQEGFTDSMDKEEFTTDELDQLNAIISEEETQDFKDIPEKTKMPGLEKQKARSKQTEHNSKPPFFSGEASQKGTKIERGREFRGTGVHTVPFTLNSKPTPGGREIRVTSVPLHWANNPVHTVPNKTNHNSKPLPTVSLAGKPASKKEPVRIGLAKQNSGADLELNVNDTVDTGVPLNDTVEPEEEVVAPSLDEVDEEEMTPVATKPVTKEGFSGSRVGLMTYLGKLLIVIILTAGSALINLKQTDTLLNKFIDKDYLIYVKVAIFALFAYVILLVSGQ